MSSPRSGSSHILEREESPDVWFVNGLGPPQEQTWGRRRRQPREEHPSARQEITEEELRRELALLGFSGIPRERLLEFKQDLEELMERRAGLIPGPEGDMARSAQPELTSDTSPSPSSSEPNDSPGEAWEPIDQQQELTPGLSRVWSRDIESPATARNAGREMWAEFSPWQAPLASQPPSRGAAWSVHSRGHISQGWSSRPTRPPHSDSYSKHSVAIGKCCSSAHVISNTPKLSNRAERLVPLLSSPTSSSSSSLDVGARHPVMKRKVLRRRQDGQTEVTDESVISETDSDIWARRAALQGEREHETDSDSLSSDSLPDRWMHRPADWDRHKSFIRPRIEPLLNGYRKKTDPVAKYMHYKQSWDAMQLSVEKARRELRWGIREQMLYKSPQVVSRPPQVYVPNEYVVPTEKKRYALRWGVRYDLLNGIMPQAN